MVWPNKTSEDSSFYMKDLQGVVIATLAPEDIEKIANLVVAKLKQENLEVEDDNKVETRGVGSARTNPVG